jgi:hypothetical protein
VGISRSTAQRLRCCALCRKPRLRSTFDPNRTPHNTHTQLGDRSAKDRERGKADPRCSGREPYHVAAFAKKHENAISDAKRIINHHGCDRDSCDKLDAEAAVTQTELASADGQIQEAQGALQVAVDEYEMKAQTPDKGRRRAYYRKPQGLRWEPRSRSNRPLKPRSAPFACAKGKAALAQAQVELDKTPVRAGLAGTVQHSTPRPGDVVNTMIRPAGILGPTGAGKDT